MQEIKKIDNSEVFKYMSVVVLPFDLQAPNQQNKAFDFEFDFKLNTDPTYLKEFYSHLKGITMPMKNIVNDKYHSHISELISTNGKSESSILKVFKINPQFLYQNNDLTINKNWVADFNNSTYIVINDFARIGYFVFAVKMTGENGVNLNDLVQTSFFRFYTNEKNTGTYKYAMLVNEKGQRGAEINKENKLTFEDIITTKFNAIYPFIKLRHQRPLLLNLISSVDNYPEDKVNEILYHSLRIHKLGENTSFENNIISAGSGMKMFILNEGAAIVDTLFHEDFKSDNFSGFFNKYFSGFMIVLNQREIMLQINQVSSQISVAVIEDSNNDIIKYLEQIKRRIDIYQFKQVFYSVSFIDELAMFYNKLQNFMNIDVLLRDSKECLNSIFVILEEDQKVKLETIRNEQNQKQEKRDLWINASLTGIGCLGLFSFFKDLIPFTLDSQVNTYFGDFSIFYKWFSSMSPIVLFIGLLRIMRKSTN